MKKPRLAQAISWVACQIRQLTEDSCTRHCPVHNWILWKRSSWFCVYTKNMPPGSIQILLNSSGLDKARTPGKFSRILKTVLFHFGDLGRNFHDWGPVRDMNPNFGFWIPWMGSGELDHFPLISRRCLTLGIFRNTPRIAFPKKKHDHLWQNTETRETMAALQAFFLWLGWWPEMFLKRVKISRIRIHGPRRNWQIHIRCCTFGPLPLLTSEILTIPRKIRWSTWVRKSSLFPWVSMRGDLPSPSHLAGNGCCSPWPQNCFMRLRCRVKVVLEKPGCRCGLPEENGEERCLQKAYSSRKRAPLSSAEVLVYQFCLFHLSFQFSLFWFSFSKGRWKWGLGSILLERIDS